MAHGANKTQFQIVAVLALITLFTHDNIFWIAALLLALVKIPDFGSPLRSIAASLRSLARNGSLQPAATAQTPDATAPSAPEEQTDA